MLRRSRFQRSNDAPPIHLTERDLTIIRHVHKHRFLRSTHVRKLVGGSSDVVLRRLQLLFQHGYLDRPRAQIDYYRRGSQPITYGLGNKGAQELAQRFGVEPGKVNWTDKNRCINRLYLEHTLAVADVMVAIELSCRDKEQARLIEMDELTTAKEQWKVTVRHRGKSETLGVVPDKVFALEFPDQPHKTALVFLEADRATMPVVRPGLKQTSFYRKMLAYHESWQQKLHTSLFGHKRCLVLTVTTSPQRVGTLIETNRAFNAGRGSGLFLFIEKTAVRDCKNFLALPFRNGRDETVTLPPAA